MYLQADKSENDKGFSLYIGTYEGVAIIDPGDIQELYFIEDIFSYCMTGKLIFNDSQGLLEKAPLTGNERIIIVYGGIGNSTGIIEGPGPSRRVLAFDIIKMGKITQSSGSDTQGSNQILFYFADTSFNYMSKRRFSKSWGKNINIKDIINHIITSTMCSNIESETERIIMDRFEPCKTTLDYYSMLYNTPMEAIKWLSRRSVSNEKNRGSYARKWTASDSIIKDNNHGYVYFNNTFWDIDAPDDNESASNFHNMFSGNWITLDKMFEVNYNEDNIYINKHPYIFSGSPVDGEKNDDGSFYIGKIKDWKLGGIDSAQKVMKGGKVLGYNFDGKKLLNRSYKYTKKDDSNVTIGVVDDAICLGSNTLFSNISSKRTNITLENFKTNEEIDSAIYYDFLRNYNRQHYISIIVDGYERRFAGQMTEIKWPSKDKGEYDDNLRGLWLTKSITHNFGTRSGYTQKIVLLKNAYNKSKNESLIDATKTNEYSIEANRLKISRSI